MKSKLQTVLGGAACLPILFFVSACETTHSATAPQASVQAPPLPPPPAETSSAPSALSYGMVTGRVKKDVTTQTEILEQFGGPSTMTTDRDGTEVWMYEKTASTVSGNYAQSTSQADRSEAGTMAAFLGIPLIGGVAGAKSAANSQSAQVSQGQSNVTRSVKTITFIIKFNPDSTVKDYAVRQASY